MDILMIASGLIGSLVCGSEKWVFWGFSVLTFIPILYQLCSWDDSLSESATYKKAMNITVVTWFFYPIVWIFAEGTGDLSSNGEAIAYTADTKSHSATWNFLEIVWILAQLPAISRYQIHNQTNLNLN